MFSLKFEKKIRFLTKRFRRRRGVSPVVAVVLLIGLVVFASAFIFLIATELLRPKVDAQISSVSLEYDSEFTKTVQDGRGHGKMFVTIYNKGTAKAKVTNVTVQYYDPTTASYVDVKNQETNPPVSKSEPVTIDPATEKVFEIKFVLPSINIDNQTVYRAVAVVSGLKDVLIEEGEGSNLVLEADRPSISLQGRVDSTIRRTITITPNANDNSEIKEIQYEIIQGTTTVYSGIKKSVAPYSFTWDTRVGATFGVNNGTYTVRATVFDYAGLNSSDEITVTVDNDYVAPTIRGLTQYASAHPTDNKGEVGQPLTVEVNATDAGSLVSEVSSIFVYYRLNGSLASYQKVSLSHSFGNTWTGNIPSSFMDSNALDNGVEYFVQVIDADGNDINSTVQKVAVIDTIKPDIFHTPITSASEGSPITVTANITDADQIAAVNGAILYYRLGNAIDNGISRPWYAMNYTTKNGDTYTWEISGDFVDIHGIEYYIYAVDRSGNSVTDGSAATPHQINVPDKSEPTVSVIQPDPSVTQIVEKQDLEIIVQIFDNDPTFGIIGTGYTATGSVILEYKDYPATQWTSITMTLHPTMNQPDGSNQTYYSFWNATIPGSEIIATDGSPAFEFKINTEDNSNNIKISSTFSLTVVQSGTPILEYVPQSGNADAPSNSTLVFTVNNTASAPATATIYALQVTFYNVSAKTTGIPIATQINASSTTVLWTNSTATEGSNATKIILDTNQTLDAGGNTVQFRIRYVNSNGSTIFPLNGFRVNVTIYFSHANGDSAVVLSSFVIPQATLFSEDFEAYAAGGNASPTWTEIAYGTSSVIDWQVVATTVIQGSKVYEGNSASGSANDDTVAYISTMTFDLPLEVVFKFYPLTASYENAFLAFDIDVADGDFYYAGARVGADYTTIGRFYGSNTWSNYVTDGSYTYNTFTIYTMKVTIDTTGTVKVYVGQGTTWNLRVTYAINGFPSGPLQIGFALENAKTYFDSLDIYRLGEGPTAPPSPLQIASITEPKDSSPQLASLMEPIQLTEGSIDTTQMEVVPITVQRTAETSIMAEDILIINLLYLSLLAAIPIALRKKVFLSYPQPS